MVIYGILTETDIGKLFIAGILPGVLMILLYNASIGAVTLFRPEWGPTGAADSDARALAHTWRKCGAVVALFVLVIGGIYGGIFTPDRGRQHRRVRRHDVCPLARAAHLADFI